ncbi:MAG TPA: putative selenium-dependent hydroxylase accessory protein YqeC [Romboutsia timonensis]|uniref:Selenium-dependent hydroxylase accessory protein YqeC n=1 Tax=Romboutsia timonensis TaxID=1776391 RepID=A0A921MZI2_9FIRM|nr:putative selenium-dependent hydroxylase accessory protein YqeC [Romboutsia timonensis]
MNLIDTFKINNKDIITIIGAGGKTSLMFSASSLLRNDYKVLVTTTTHIYVPDNNLYDKIIMLTHFENENYNNILQNNKNGVYVIGSHIVNNSKIKGLTFDMLDKITPYFDVVIIEGDGSKEKSLKGWNDNEPVIYPKTTKTIGIVDISSIGIDINEENIHRVDKFLDIINDYSNNKVNIEHLEKLILNKNGLFKFYKGEKILFINKVEDINKRKNALNIIKDIKNENQSYIDKFIYGSIFNNEFIKG